MRLVDASDDDALNVQAWGNGFSEAAWVLAARGLATLAADWHARTATAPWDAPGALFDLLAASLWHTGGAAGRLPGGVYVFAGADVFALATVPSRLDLAAYDPDAVLGALMDAGLVDAAAMRPPAETSGTLRGALVGVVHHALQPRAGARPGIDRIKAVPLPSVERRAARGLRIDLFPPWALALRHPGVTLLLGLAPTGAALPPHG